MKSGEKKFTRNMAIGAATGAVAGGAGATALTRGRVRFTPVHDAALGGLAGGGVGLGMVAHRKHKSKIKKSAFGVDHAL